MIQDNKLRAYAGNEKRTAATINFNTLVERSILSNAILSYITDKGIHVSSFSYSLKCAFVHVHLCVYYHWAYWTKINEIIRLHNSLLPTRLHTFRTNNLT